MRQIVRNFKACICDFSTGHTPHNLSHQTKSHGIMSQCVSPLFEPFCFANEIFIVLDIGVYTCPATIHETHDIKHKELQKSTQLFVLNNNPTLSKTSISTIQKDDRSFSPNTKTL